MIHDSLFQCYYLETHGYLKGIEFWEPDFTGIDKSDVFLMYNLDYDYLNPMWF